jgi:hypothetical protein
VEGVFHLRGEEVALPVGALLELAPALRRHAVRRAYSAVLTDAPPLGSVLVEAVLGWPREERVRARSTCRVGSSSRPAAGRSSPSTGG